jgi:hypothetical protein
MLPCAFPVIALLECTNVTPQCNGCFIIITRKVAFKVKMSKRRVNAIIRGRLKAYGYAFGVISLLLWLSEDYISSLHLGFSISFMRHIFMKHAITWKESLPRKIILANVYNSSFDGISDLGVVGVSIMCND